MWQILTQLRHHLAPVPRVSSHLSKNRDGASEAGARLFCWLLVAGLCAAFDARATQPAYVEAEASQPASADEIKSPLRRALDKREDKTRRPSFLRQYLADLPPFWRDTQLSLKPRLYNFDRQRSDSPDELTFAAGAAVEYRSGFWRDRFALGLTGYTAQKLRGPGDAGVTGMLRPEQNGFGVLGEAFATIRLQPYAEMRLYRQGLHLPYFNRQDSRMVPKIHEAYLIGQPRPGKLQWVAGHVTRIKLSNSDRFVPLSESAGFDGTDKGATIAGLVWNANEHSNIGMVNYQAWDFMNITYLEGKTVLPIRADIPLALSAQATYQKSTGDELGGGFGTYTVGGSASLSYRHGVASLAGTYTDDDARIRSPFGGKPSYLSIMIADFDRAGEAAWLAGFSYNFARLGIDGLGFDVKYAQGYVKDARPDRREFDFTLDYKPQRSLLRNFWFRARYAKLDVDDGSGFDDVRLIVNYEIPII